MRVTSDEKIFYLEKAVEQIQSKIKYICNKLDQGVKKKLFYFMIGLIFTIISALHGFMIAANRDISEKLQDITNHIARIEAKIERR